jgi:hypothetical protein
MDTQMDEHANEVPLFDEIDYSAWRIEMKGFLKEKGKGIWNASIGGSVPLKNKSNFATQKEANNNDALALKTIFNGISSSVKESMGKCTSTKDLWLNLEEVYQVKEDNPINENEGEDSPKYFDYDTPSEFECSLTKEEADIEDVCIEFANNEEEYLLEIKYKIITNLEEFSMEIGYGSLSFEYLEKYTKEVLEKYPSHIMALKKILMKQEEEIKKLKNDITSQVEANNTLDDELRKILEHIKIYVNLITQLE